MNGIEIYEKANHFKLQVIVAKKKDSEYLPGARTKQWVKVKVSNGLRQYLRVYKVGRKLTLF